jgi:hypothetical protein
MEYLNFMQLWHNSWMVSIKIKLFDFSDSIVQIKKKSIKFHLIFSIIFLVRLHESMRELEQLRSKPELAVATLLALIHAHKQHKTPGTY